VDTCGHQIFFAGSPPHVPAPQLASAVEGFGGVFFAAGFDAEARAAGAGLAAAGAEVAVDEAGVDDAGAAVEAVAGAVPEPPLAPAVAVAAPLGGVALAGEVSGVVSGATLTALAEVFA
jgi:hypothetical protein